MKVGARRLVLAFAIVGGASCGLYGLRELSTRANQPMGIYCPDGALALPAALGKALPRQGGDYIGVMNEVLAPLGDRERLRRQAIWAGASCPPGGVASLDNHRFQCRVELACTVRGPYYKRGVRRFQAAFDLGDSGVTALLISSGRTELSQHAAEGAWADRPYFRTPDAAVTMPEVNIVAPRDRD